LKILFPLSSFLDIFPPPPLSSVVEEILSVGGVWMFLEVPQWKDFRRICRIPVHETESFGRSRKYFVVDGSDWKF
jgi:hypothetical protein